MNKLKEIAAIIAQIIAIFAIFAALYAFLILGYAAGMKM